MHFGKKSTETMLCYAIVCLLSSLWNNDGSCEDRKIVWEHTGFHVSFTQFSPTVIPYVTDNTTPEPGKWHGYHVGLLFYAILSRVHMCNHCYQNTELFNHHKDLPHAASLWSHLLPSGSLPCVFHPWQPLICPPSLSFCHLESI